MEQYLELKTAAEALIAAELQPDGGNDDGDAKPGAAKPVKTGSKGGRKGTDRDGRMLRDDIDWEAIATKVGTRTGTQCSAKWYDQLRPNMTDKGEWAVSDDSLLLSGIWRKKPAMVCAGHNSVSLG